MDPETQQPSESQELRESLRFVLLREAEATGAAWDVMVLEEGVSLNGAHYSRELLERSARLFESAGVYAYELGRTLDHLPETIRQQLGQGVGLLRHRIGQLTEARYGESGGRRGILARLSVAADWARDVLREVWRSGQQAGIGFSIDTAARLQARPDGTREVVEIAPHPTLDLVSHPAAGGRLVRLVASRGGQQMPEQETTGTQTTTTAPAPPAAPPAPDLGQLVDARLREAEQRHALTLDIRTTVAERIAGSGLPSQAIRRLAESFRGRLFLKVDEATAAVEAAVAAERDYIQSLTGAAQVTGLGGQVRESAIQVGADKLDKLQAAMDGFFSDSDQKGVDGKTVPRFLSLRESIHEITGGFLGVDVTVEQVLGMIARYQPHPVGQGTWSRRTESVAQMGAPFRRVTESATSSTWAQILGDAITRRMIREYSLANRQSHLQIVSEISAPQDFRTQRRMRWGGYGLLPAVGEGHIYQPLATPGDEEETYTVSKRGGTEDITMEAIANDDQGLVRRIPVALGRAAIQTLRRFVFGLLTGNGLMADGVACFNGAHGNLGAAALTPEGLRDRRVAMWAQTAYGNATEVLGEVNTPKYLLVHHEQLDLAWTLINSMTALWEPDGTGAVPGDANATTPNVPWNRQLTVIPVEFWTDINDWYLVADPANIPTIELGFFQGRRDPELFVQSDPTTGSYFTSDKVSWKIRHIYGGKILDHRGLDASIVAP